MVGPLALAACKPPIERRDKDVFFEDKETKRRALAFAMVNPRMTSRCPCEVR